jgi:hypothetical protein
MYQHGQRVHHADTKTATIQPRQNACTKMHMMVLQGFSTMANLEWGPVEPFSRGRRTEASKGLATRGQKAGLAELSSGVTGFIRAVMYVGPSAAGFRVPGLPFPVEAGSSGWQRPAGARLDDSNASKYSTVRTPFEEKSI